MRYLALATDYDGTLAHHGKVDPDTVEGLRRLAASGRKLILVTGRQVDDLPKVFPEVSMFDRVVAENGAVIYRTDRKETRALAPPPPPAVVEALRQRGVDPLAVGQVVVATVQPHEAAALDAIRELGLEMEIIFNKGSVMILPSSVNKATGLRAALEELTLSPHNVVGVGDAENDHALLTLCECGVAVANALDSLKEDADYVTTGPHGGGVGELIEAMVADDLRSLPLRRERRRIALGHVDDELITVPAFGPSLLVAGASGSGKSSIVRGFLERLAEARYQFCVVDPEGDYDELPVALTLGTPDRAPTVDEAMAVLDEVERNLVVNLVGLRLQDRPRFFEALLPRIQECRARTGRPHWLVVDEAHHLMPRSWGPVELTLPETLNSTMLVTVHPDRLAQSVLDRLDSIIAVGTADDVLRAFGKRTAQRPGPGEALLWSSGDSAPRLMRTMPGRLEQRRHVRKYAAGDLGPNAFTFRGPDGRLNLRAQNLQTFLQMAEGVDDATWLHHLKQHDYSAWFSGAIKDPELQEAAAHAERLADAPAAESRRIIKDAIERRYTTPA